MEVRNFKAYEGKGALKGFFELYIPGWAKVTIRGMSYMENEKGAWVNFPSKSFENQEGETKYMPYLRFEDEETAKRFTSEVVRLIKAHNNSNSNSSANCNANSTRSSANEDFPF